MVGVVCDVDDDALTFPEMLPVVIKIGSTSRPLGFYTAAF